MRFTPHSTTARIITASVCIGLILPSLASAATNPANVGQALEIAPPVISLTANPGQVIKTQISLRDVSATKLIVKGQVNDFVAQGENGTPKLLLDEGETSPYSMKTWFRPLSELTLKPKQVENLPVTINVPANAAPGGYFAVVRFTASAPELNSTGVSLSASLGALVLIRVNGDAKEGLSVEQFAVTTPNGAVNNLFESTPIKFIQRLKNTGNVHEQPAGQVTITNMFGKKVAAVNVNLPPRNILPQSIRRFEEPLDKSVIGNTRLFGRYTADLKITYGDKGQVLTDSVTFWVIPYKLIAISLFGLIVGFLLLRTTIRRYNQSIIKRAQKTSKKK